MPELIKGLETVKAIRAANALRMQALQAKGITPCLAVVRVGERADDIAYETGAAKNCKNAGVRFTAVVLPQTADTQTLVQTVRTLSEDASISGIMVLRPLPKTVDEQRVMEAIDPDKDVDGATRANQAGVYAGVKDSFAPCTAEAVVRLLKYNGIAIAGREAVVIGRSPVVGRPLAMLMLKENATVTVCHTKTADLEAVCRRADLLLVAAGQRAMVDDRFIRPGAGVVDVGIHVDEDGKLCGDVAKTVQQPAWVTPVPGGVGGVTSALLIEHVLRAAERKL
ncbi:MAG: bifunctional 5,10-methylenetetrahydrofolate dehydrogenase/5,10-methenyltetrahydrofolate cyclohydrolase [Clostridia bacterium]|nr:bifunctional 5,10-methylenetetrahydrofolate dehydrogenase/5,10-methenyltetrahydrofolate cyclohydrolase [Clostridia bacterium]